MNSPHYAKLAAKLLAEAPDRAVEVSESERARTLERIALALSAKTRRRARRAWLIGFAATLAVSVFGYVGVRGARRSATAGVKAVSAVVLADGGQSAIIDQGTTRALEKTTALSQGGRLIAGASGSATVLLSSGTELSIEHDSNLEFEDAGLVERFFLGKGMLRAKVAKLKPNERFIVRTPDAEVEVRGTTFRVEVVEPDAKCAAGARTRVTVSEGLVEVRGAGASTYVHPGETWPANCPAPAVKGPSELASPTGSGAPAALPRAPAGHAWTKPSAGEAAVDRNAEHPVDSAASSTARQNQLFSEAAAARRQGNTAAALSAFERLMALYPASPLAESAAVQRLSLLEGNSPAAAKTAARQYLARYPRGYARSDAEKLIAQP